MSTPSGKPKTLSLFRLEPAWFKGYPRSGVLGGLHLPLHTWCSAGTTQNVVLLRWLKAGPLSPTLISQQDYTDD